MADLISMQEIAAGIAQVGFPVIAFYLMYQMARETINENTKALVDIRLTLEKVCERMENSNH